MRSFLFVLLLPFLCAAIDEEGFLRDRDLANFGGDGRLCQFRLNRCDGPAELPVESWSQYLQSDDEWTNQIKEIIQDAQTIDFSSMADPKPERDASETIASLRTVLKELKVLSGSLSNVDSLESALIQVQGVVREMNTISAALFENVDLQTIFNVVIFVVQLGLAISGGPVTLTLFILNQIVKFATNFGLDAMSVAMLPNMVDGECLAALNQCRFNELMAETVPFMVGGAMAAASAEAAP